MRQPYTLDDLREALVRACGMPPEQARRLEPHSSLAEAGLDSACFLAMELELEQRFGLEPSDEGLALLETVDQVLAYVNRTVDRGPGTVDDD